MRLSVLIPTYNYDCHKLVETLHRQLPDDCEIIVLDDCSSDEDIKKQNRQVGALKNVTYKEEQVNQGRSRVRNHLTKLANGDYVLFIDCDALVDNPEFLNNYIRLLPTKAVVCGSMEVPETMPSTKVSLRWKYERHFTLHKYTEKRNKSPWDNISTFNIMFPRKVALEHNFDESIRRYGYEDTLIGQELSTAGIAVLHIDNPLIHNGMDTNEEYLCKTEQALQTLYSIRYKVGRHSRLLVTYERLKCLHLAWLTKIWFNIMHNIMRRNLINDNPSLLVFNIYKLGYYANIAR